MPAQNVESAASALTARRAQLFGAIAAVSIAGMGLSLSAPLIALRFERAGYSAEANGLGVATAGVATLLFAPFVPRLARKFGARGLCLLSLAVAVAGLLAFAFAPDILWYFPIRFVFSCALTSLFVTSEFTINALSPADSRGVWIGIYSTCLAIGFAAGPLILTATGPDGRLPFFAGIALFAVAAAPILASGSALPALEEKSEARVLTFLARAPSLMCAAFVFGAIETSGMGLLPVHALRNGYAAASGAALVSALALGNMLFQIPLGLLSDRLNRARLLAIVAAVSLAGALALAGLTGSLAFVPVLIVWSGVASGLYMVGLAELGARYAGADLAAANAAFVMCYACGMMAGPPLAGKALDLSPQHGLFGALAGFIAFALAVILVRARAKG